MVITVQKDYCGAICYGDVLIIFGGVLFISTAKGGRYYLQGEVRGEKCFYRRLLWEVRLWCKNQRAGDVLQHLHEDIVCTRQLLCIPVLLLLSLVWTIRQCSY